MTTLFQEGEVVLGKIKGYPYWPAKIIEISNTMTYTIKFFSDNSYAKLSSKYILKYKENKNKILEANKKNKKLVSSFKAADLDIKKSENINNIPDEQKIITNDETLPNLKANINSQNISSKTLNSNNNFEPKNLEKINKNNNLINLSEIMSGQNNRVNIFSITKNSKNIITINNSNSQTIEDPVVEDTHNSQENKSAIIESDNNNHIIIDKNILNIENDEELSSLLQNNKNNLENKMESEKSLKTVNEKKEEIKETKPEKYFLRIEIENLEVKNVKKKEIKKKLKVDDKLKEEKKKIQEEDNFLYEIDEYFYKILELFNKKNFDKLDYEKVQFRRVLIYLANFKRKNFVDFLKMTNISKYIQYFACYLKDYDKELSILAKNVYRNFHKQFNREYFGNKKLNV
jgi:hypothetical protein